MENKDSFIGLRISGETKRQLEEVADQEGRSLSQVCELLIKGALETYRKQGSSYLQRLAVRVSRRRGDREHRE